MLDPQRKDGFYVSCLRWWGVTFVAIVIFIFVYFKFNENIWIMINNSWYEWQFLSLRPSATKGKLGLDHLNLDFSLKHCM